MASAWVDRGCHRHPVHPHLYTARLPSKCFPWRGQELRVGGPRSGPGHWGATLRLTSTQSQVSSEWTLLHPASGSWAALRANGEELIPSRAVPVPEPGVSALAAEFRPRRREECSRVISSEAEKRLRSGPSRPTRVGPDSSSGLGSSVLRACSAAWPGWRKTAWASGLPGTSSRWYTRILRPAGRWGESTGWHPLGSLPTFPLLPCGLEHLGNIPERKGNVFAEIWSPEKWEQEGYREHVACLQWVKGGQRARGPRTTTHLLWLCNLRQVTCLS